MTSASTSSLLRRKLALVSGRLKAAAASFWSHPRLVELYPTALVANYSIVRATVPLMERGRRRALELAPLEPVCSAIATYLEKHIAEERGHDEWVLEDLEALGYERDLAARSLPSPTSAALVGAQYYWIDHVHPAAALGYIAVLEGDPPEEREIERVIERSGLPAESFRTLSRHARLDPTHRDELDAALDAMALSSKHWDVVGVSALQTVSLLARVLEEVVELGEFDREVEVGGHDRDRGRPRAGVSVSSRSRS